MKVILLQDVAKLGKRFEIVDVPHGHALNKLIPQGLAQEATPQNVKSVEARATKMRAEQVAADTSFGEALKAAKDKIVTISVEANDQGHLFEALKTERIAEVLKEEGIAVKSAQIHVSTPIKEVGDHTLMLESGDQSGEMKVTVVAK